MEARHKIVSYIAMREGLLSMNSASIVRVGPTGSEEEYGSLSMAKIRDVGAITLAKDDGQTQKYDIKRRKSIKGFIVTGTESDEDESVLPFARGLRDGMISKTMKIVLGGTLFYMFNEGFLKYKFCVVRVGQVKDIRDDSDIDDMIKNEVDRKDKLKMKELTVGHVEKDGLFKNTYSMKFFSSVPKLLPGLVMWFSIMFERQDAGAAA